MWTWLFFNFSFLALAKPWTLDGFLCVKGHGNKWGSTREGRGRVSRRKEKNSAVGAEGTCNGLEGKRRSWRCFMEAHWQIIVLFHYYNIFFFFHMKFQIWRFEDLKLVKTVISPFTQLHLTFSLFLFFCSEFCFFQDAFFMPPRMSLSFWHSVGFWRCMLLQTEILQIYGI